MKTYEEALWAWFIPRAQRFVPYCGWRDLPEPVVTHLQACGINRDLSDDPASDEVVADTGDTYNEADRVPAMTVYRWQCNCREYGTHPGSRNDMDTLAVLDYPTTKMLFEVIQEASK